MLDYIKELFSDKKTYTIFIVTFAVAMFVVVFFIWKPDGEAKEFATYEQINVEEKYKEVAKGYLDEMILYFRYNRKGEVLSRISEEYLNYIGISKEEISSSILDDKITGFSGLEIYSKKGYNVYSTNLIYENGKTRIMNILEKKPYDYSIAFDDFCDYQAENIGVSVNGLIFNSGHSYDGLTKKAIEFSITNNTNGNVSFDFSDTRKVCLKLEGGEEYYLNNSIISNKLSNITQGTTINEILEFAIPFSEQEEIVSMIFKDVNINGKLQDITVDL